MGVWQCPNCDRYSQDCTTTEYVEVGPSTYVNSYCTCRYCGCRVLVNYSIEVHDTELQELKKR